MRPRDPQADGLFYVLQLDPFKNPGRIKLGWSANLQQRLTHYATIVPESKLLGCWPCVFIHERSVISYLAPVATRRLTAELFEFPNVSKLLEQCETYFVRGNVAMDFDRAMPTASVAFVERFPKAHRNMAIGGGIVLDVTVPTGKPERVMKEWLKEHLWTYLGDYMADRADESSVADTRIFRVIVEIIE